MLRKVLRRIVHRGWSRCRSSSSLSWGYSHYMRQIQEVPYPQGKLTSAQLSSPGSSSAGYSAGLAPSAPLSISPLQIQVESETQGGLRTFNILHGSGTKAWNREHSKNSVNSFNLCILVDNLPPFSTPAKITR